MRFLFVSLCFINLSWASDLSCLKGELRLTEFGKTRVEKSDYCFDKTFTVLVSSNCTEKKCGAYQDKRSFQKKEFLSSVGSPSFKLCRLLGGQPEILEFLANNKFYQLDRCLFKDGSFVDTGELYKFYLQKK